MRLTSNMKCLFLFHILHCPCILSLFIKLQQNTLKWVTYTVLSDITLSPTCFDSYRDIIRETNTREYKHMLTVTSQSTTYASLSIQNVAASYTVHVYSLFDISMSAPYIQGVTGGTDQTSGGCSLC